MDHGMSTARVDSASIPPESGAAIIAAFQAQYEFDQISEHATFRAQLPEGLHGASLPHDVILLLAEGAPIDGLQEIDYEDGRAHWETPLLTALIEGRYAAAQALIEAGADPDAPCFIGTVGHWFAHTALHKVIGQRGAIAVQILIDAGADVNRETTVGSTPLHIAAIDDNSEIARILMEAGADASILNSNGTRARDVAGPQTAPIFA